MLIPMEVGDLEHPLTIKKGTALVVLLTLILKTILME